jgi:hypothetical protein
MCLINFLTGKPEGRIALGRHRHTWKDNIIKDLRGIWL